MKEVKKILDDIVKENKGREFVDLSKRCRDYEEECHDYEEGTYSDGTPRKYLICWMHDPCGYCPFLSGPN